MYYVPGGVNCVVYMMSSNSRNHTINDGHHGAYFRLRENEADRLHSYLLWCITESWRDSTLVY